MHLSAPTRRRRQISLTLVLAVVVNALMPLAQATAGSDQAGTLFATICSPNGLRYVEIDLGPPDTEPPRPPDLGTLDHCPGCLGAAPAVIRPRFRSHYSRLRNVTIPGVDALC